jgi:mannose-1-phosphate guanylyltransferase/phosphomannomutase
MGTAGAVKCAEKFLDERFLVISGDLLTDFNLKKIMDFHVNNKALATITDSGQRSAAVRRGYNRQEQEDYPLPGETGLGEVISDTVNTGIYVFEPEIFRFIPEGKTSTSPMTCSPFCSKTRVPVRLPHQGYWRDIGNTDSIREAHHDIFSGRINIRIDEHKLDLLGKDIRIGAEVNLEDTTTLEGTVIMADNSQILGRAHIKIR